jgi:hypothetical protein
VERRLRKVGMLVEEEAAALLALLLLLLAVDPPLAPPFLADPLPATSAELPLPNAGETEAAVAVAPEEGARNAAHVVVQGTPPVDVDRAETAVPMDATESIEVEAAVVMTKPSVVESKKPFPLKRGAKETRGEGAAPVLLLASLLLAPRFSALPPAAAADG